MSSRHMLRRTLGRTGSAVRAVLFVALTLISLTLAAPSSAYADFSCNFTGDDQYQMDTAGDAESVFPAYNQWDKGATDEKKNQQGLNIRGSVTGPVEMSRPPEMYTMYELNGLRGLNFSQTFKGRGDASEDNGDFGSGADNCAVMDLVYNGAADTIFTFTKFFTRMSISIKETASNPSPMAGLYEGRDSVVKTLKVNVLQPAVVVMILLVGLWVFTKWRAGDTREVWAGISWAALSIIGVMAFLTGSNYDKFVTWSDTHIGDANTALMSTALAGVSGEMQPPCDLKDNYNKGLRQSSCAMYDTLIFRPWALGQFGAPGKNCIFKKKGDGKVSEGVCVPDDKNYSCSYGRGARCEDLRVRQLVAQSATNKDLGKDLDKMDDEWVPIRKDIAGGEDIDTDDTGDQEIYPVAFDTWAGKNAGGRVGVAFYSLLASFVVGTMVIILSGLTLLWHAVTLILIVMLPLVAAIGMHPSQQKLLKGWLEAFVHSFVLRAGFSVILTLLLVLYQMIFPADIALGSQLLLLMLVSIAVVMMIRKLIEKLTNGEFTPAFGGGQIDPTPRPITRGDSDWRPRKNHGAVQRPGQVAAKAAVGTGRVAATAAKKPAIWTGEQTVGRAWRAGREAVQRRRNSGNTPQNPNQGANQPGSGGTGTQKATGGSGSNGGSGSHGGSAGNGGGSGRGGRLGGSGSGGSGGSGGSVGGSGGSSGGSGGSGGSSGGSGGSGGGSGRGGRVSGSGSGGSGGSGGSVGGSGGSSGGSGGGSGRGGRVSGSDNS
ncbi:hypothetical protein ACFV0R_05135 [Streptomyces sp. NPDC059578]|uniref:hypothetical protein n=1 Tax=Streptomyces sp. NPDC059578 TaxID=3346874 RepID=UPI0036C92A10